MNVIKVLPTLLDNEICSFLFRLERERQSVDYFLLGAINIRSGSGWGVWVLQGF